MRGTTSLLRHLAQLKKQLRQHLEVNTPTSLHHYPLTLDLLNGHQAERTLSAKVPIKMFTAFALRGGNGAAVGPPRNVFKRLDSVREGRIPPEGSQKVPKHGCDHQLFSEKVNISHALGIRVKFCRCLSGKYLKINILWVRRRARKSWREKCNWKANSDLEGNQKALSLGVK